MSWVNSVVKQEGWNLLEKKKGKLKKYERTKRSIKTKKNEKRFKYRNIEEI